MQLPADTGIPAGPPLEFHLTRDRPVRDLGVRMEVRGTVISLEDRDGPTGLEQLLHQLQRCDWIGEVFEHKADVERVHYRAPAFFAKHSISTAMPPGSAPA